jgi:NAD(P)-dependent dehydrogenase (short-subunit alcohol dehydrogenase family)
MSPEALVPVPLALAGAYVAGVYHTRCTFQNTDVAKEHEVEALMVMIKEKYGRLDYCMVNAGIEGERALVQDYPTKAFDEVRSTTF